MKGFFLRTMKGDGRVFVRMGLRFFRKSGRMAAFFSSSGRRTGESG